MGSDAFSNRNPKPSGVELVNPLMPTRPVGVVRSAARSVGRRPCDYRRCNIMFRVVPAGRPGMSANRSAGSVGRWGRQGGVVQCGAVQCGAVQCGAVGAMHYPHTHPPTTTTTTTLFPPALRRWPRPAGRSERNTCETLPNIYEATSSQKMVGPHPHWDKRFKVEVV